MGQSLVRFAVTPPPKRGPNEPFAAQLALARVHPCLVALERTPGGYGIPREATRGWFELRAKRGLAGYGLARALRILLDALAGLSALEDTRTAAGQPFVHGELVPAMLRVDRSGTARLIPLAPWHWSAPGTLPAQERCGHLAPERLLGDAIDARADVFSAGALLWEALAGRRLFETDSVDNIVTRLLGDKVTLPQLPPELNWAVPLKAVAMCALSVDPGQRFENCAELAEAIEAVAGDRVATHADVADYFGAPEPTARPSVIVRPLPLPPHHSSLSALVAPVRRTVPVPAAELSPSQPVSREPDAPKRTASRPLWAIAAVTCLITAVGVSAVARYQTAHEPGHAAARSAPPLGAPLPPPVTPPPPSTPPALSASAEPALPASAEPAAAEPASAEPQETVPAASAVPSSRAIPSSSAIPASAIPAKPGKGSNASKGGAPKLRSPAKALHSKAAAKYGI